jgi:hypothetical protein
MIGETYPYHGDAVAGLNAMPAWSVSTSTAKMFGTRRFGRRAPKPATLDLYLKRISLLTRLLLVP